MVQQEDDDDDDDDDAKYQILTPSLSLSLNKSIVFWLIIDGQIINVKLKFISLVLVSLISTREISCSHQEVGNLLASP